MDRIRGLFVVALAATAVVAGGNVSAAPKGGDASTAPGRERAEANCLAHVDDYANGRSERGGNCEHNWPSNRDE